MLPCSETLQALLGLYAKGPEQRYAKSLGRKALDMQIICVRKALVGGEHRRCECVSLLFVEVDSPELRWCKHIKPVMMLVLKVPHNKNVMSHKLIICATAHCNQLVGFIHLSLFSKSQNVHSLFMNKNTKRPNFFFAFFC